MNMKKRVNKFIIVFIVFFSLISLNGCWHRHTKSYSLDELQQNLICVELVKFGYKDGKEISYYEAKNMGLEEQEIYDIYETYKVLNEEDMIQITNELSNITFKNFIGPPQDFNGDGIVLKYSDKTYYISIYGIRGFYDNGQTYLLDHCQRDEIKAIINKYMNDTDNSCET